MNLRYGLRIAHALEAATHDERSRELFALRTEILDHIADVKVRAKLVELDRLQQRRLRQLERALDDVGAALSQLHFGLVRSYARLFARRDRPSQAEEFDAAGMVGLMEAISDYDPTQSSFASWAFPKIQRQALSTLREEDFQLLSHGDVARRPAVLAALHLLEGQRPGHQPGYAEIAAEAGVSERIVRRVLEGGIVTSLDKPIDGDDGIVTLGESVASGDMAPGDLIACRRFLDRLTRYGLGILDERELMVLVRTMGLDGEARESLDEIGERWGVTREAIRQVRQKALAKIQHPVILRKIVLEQAA